jgi:hypothetical protein
MGRYPYLGRFQSERKNGYGYCNECYETNEYLGAKKQKVEPKLAEEKRQRVIIARGINPRSGNYALR